MRSARTEPQLLEAKYPKVALYAPSASGGIAHYTFELAEGLAKIGCPVTLITSEDYELRHSRRSFDIWLLFKRSRVKALLLRMSQLISGRARDNRQSLPDQFGSATDPLLPVWLIARLKSLRFTCDLLRAALVLLVRGTRIVHFQCMLDRRADLRFMHVLHLLRFKIVYTVHDLLPHDEHTAENRAFYERVYRIPDSLIVHAENNRKEMLELFTVDPGKITVIPHGCQSVLFEHVATPPTAARAELGIPEDRQVILFFGLIKRYKGLDVLLQAFDTIKSSCDKAMLLIAGPIAGDPATCQRYSTLLAQCSSDDRIRVRNEYVPLVEVGSYFSAADLVVLPYLRASQSGVLLAAYAAGKPVVVTDTGGLSEVVKNGRTGFVVPPNDARAIAEASITILNDPALRERFGLEGKRLAETTFSWTTIGSTTAELYQSLVQPGSALRFTDGKARSLSEHASS
jgi:D-inositol-3-phosphate glycosyltransferase